MPAARQSTADHVRRGARGKWLPGTSPNPGGRPKVIESIRDLARQHTDTAIAALVKIAEAGKNESARVAASTALLDRGWGKPTQPLSGDAEMPPIGMSVVDSAAERAEKVAAAKARLDAVFGELD